MDSKLTKPAGSIRTGRLPGFKNNKWNTRFGDRYSNYQPEIRYYRGGIYTAIIFYCDIHDLYIGVGVSSLSKEPKIIGTGTNKDKDKLKESIDYVINVKLEALEKSNNK